MMGMLASIGGLKNPHSQLKIMGYFKPQGKHLNAIHFILVKRSLPESYGKGIAVMKAK